MFWGGWLGVILLLLLFWLLFGIVEIWLLDVLDVLVDDNGCEVVMLVLMIFAVIILLLVGVGRLFFRLIEFGKLVFGVDL